VILELCVTNLDDIFWFVCLKTQLFGILDWFQVCLNVFVADDGFNTGVVHVDDQVFDLQILVLNGGGEVDEFHWLSVVFIAVLD